MNRIIPLLTVIVAMIGLLASVIAASLSYYFTKKYQLKMEERRLKEEFYKLFIKALSDVAINNKDSEAQKDFQRESIPYFL
jgi:peptidoglycan/LPS O-acetylase OafA/YrhL